MRKVTCDNLIVTCMDFRIQERIADYAKGNLNGQYDYISFPGATKSLELILEQIELAVSLHQVRRILLIHHEDCGAYGATGSLDRHRHDLKIARCEIEKRYPEMLVELLYVPLEGALITL